MAYIFPISIWIVLLGFFFAICLAIEEGIARLQRLHQVPCSHCAFFTGDVISQSNKKS